jgi:subtilisin family serine protease
MNKSKKFIFECGAAKAVICFALMFSLFTVYVTPASAITPPAAKTNAQLLGGLLGGGGLLPSVRLIVRDTKGLLGLNLTCIVFGCKVVEGIGDPDGQLYVVTVASLLSPLVLITNLLSGAGITNVEQDQPVNTLGNATAGSTPAYLSDKTPVSYYGATVWEGYVEQTPNEIINTENTQSAFGVTGSGVTVALIDTGVDPSNTILKSHLVYGYDFTRNTAGGSEMADVSQSTVAVLESNGAPATVNQSTVAVLEQSTVAVLEGTQYAAFGHGTMTAGIVHLVAPQAQLMPLKAFTSSGTGLESDILRAIYYAVNHGAKVINMSFAFTSSSKELANAINYANSRGVICVASAGNDSKMETVYPAGLPNVIDVASTSANNTPSAFSNYGAPPVWLSAPGEAVMTTYPYNTYAAGWGTSFSAPMVSGTVALMAGTNGLLLNEQEAAEALSNATPIPYSQFGHGVLNTYHAFQAWKSDQVAGGGLLP